MSDPSDSDVSTEVDRRATVRFPCNLKNTCGLPEADPAARWPAEVQDLSCTGIRLLVHCRFEPRSMLVIELPISDSGSSEPILAKVVHVKRQGPDSWMVGCVFRRLLHAEEVEAVLRQSEGKGESIPPRGLEPLS